MSSPEHKKKIWNMIKAIKVGMLTTELGSTLHARPMHLVQEDYDGTLWFFTRKDDQKVFEVESHRGVCLTFADVKAETYVSLSGKARLNTDRSLIEKFWNPFAAAWFPKGKDDPDIALLEVKISAGEHWDATSSRLLQLFEIGKANVTGAKPDLGENEKFGNIASEAS